LEELIEAGIVTHSHQKDKSLNATHPPCTVFERAEWVALFDVDQFVTLTNYKLSLHDLLSDKKLKEVSALIRFSVAQLTEARLILQAGGVGLYWKFFFSNCHLTIHDQRHTVTSQV